MEICMVGVVGTGVPKTNFLKETIDKLAERNLVLDDIIFLGSTDGSTYVDLDKLLERLSFEYNSSYGEIIIPLNLTASLSDGSSLIRWESDGAEGWSWMIRNKLENAREIQCIGNFSIFDRKTEFSYDRGK